jgi:hypothetical protein
MSGHRRMRAVLLTIVALPLAVLASSLAAICWENSAGPDDQERLPRAIVENAQHDFGRVTAGENLEAQFVVRNAGTRRLILRQLNGSCDCLVGVPEILIEPGGRHVVSARIDTSRLEGPFQLDLSYRSNDANAAKLKFAAMLDVVRP